MVAVPLPGIERRWPTVMNAALASLLVRARAATVVPWRWAISDRVSPAFTVYTLRVVEARVGAAASRVPEPPMVSRCPG